MIQLREKEAPGRHIVDVLFVLALFGVFAASALMLVTIGANVYRQTVSNMSEHFNERTAYSYLSEKLRQSDTVNAVTIEELEGISAIALSQTIEDQEICTYLYLYDGYLRELTIRKDSYAGSDLLSAGESILPLAGLSMEDCGGALLKITLDTGDGEVTTLYAALHSEYT